MTITFGPDRSESITMSQPQHRSPCGHGDHPVTVNADGVLRCALWCKDQPLPSPRKRTRSAGGWKSQVATFGVVVAMAATQPFAAKPFNPQHMGYVSPSWPVIAQTQASPASCTYTVTGARKRLITVAVPGAGHGETVTVEVVKGSAAWITATTMPTIGHVTVRAPFNGGAGTWHRVTVDRTLCGRA